MKKRYHLLIIIGVLLVGFILGSFLDLQINQAIYSDQDGFGLFMESFGVYPAFALTSSRYDLNVPFIRITLTVDGLFSLRYR